MVEECNECGSEETSVIPHAGPSDKSKVICFNCETTYMDAEAETTSPDYDKPWEDSTEQASLDDWM